MESFGLPKRDALSEKEKEDYENRRIAYAKEFRAKYHPGSWSIAFDPNEQNKVQDIDEASVASSGPKKLVNGLYHRSGKEGKSIDISYQDGKFTPCVEKKFDANGQQVGGGITSNKEFKEVYGQVFDMMGANGIKNIEIDFKAGAVTEKKLLAAMKLANDRGQTIDFGPNIQKYLENCSESKRKRILHAQETLCKNQRTEKILTGVDSDKEELKQHERKMDDLNDDNLAAKNDYLTKLSGTSVDDSLEKITKALDEATKRVDTAKAAKDKVKESLTGYESVVKNPQDFAKDPHLTKLTMSERFREGLKKAAPVIAATVLLPPVGIGMAIHRTVKEVKKAKAEAKELVKQKQLDDPLRLVKEVKAQSNLSKDEREKTLNTLKELVTDLEKRRDAINEKIAELKAPLEAKGTARAGDEKKQWKKIEELEKKAEKLDQTIKQTKNEAAGLETKHKDLPGMLDAKEKKLVQEQQQAQQKQLKT